MKKIILLITGVAFSITTNAQNKVKLDSLFTTLEKYNKAYAAVTINKNGKKIYSNVNGFADIEKKIRNTANTQFRIGSVSKMFTAVMIHQLVEEGKLSYETTLNKFIAEVPNASKINIAQLLKHQTGIFNITTDSNYMNYCDKGYSQKEFTKILNAYGPQFEPGSQTDYSNSNFILLSYIIEQLDKKPFAASLQDRICKKIDLKETKCFEATHSAIEAWSYAREDDKWVLAETKTHPSIPLGAGNILSTTNDLVIFVEALFSEKLIQQKTLDRMMEMKEGEIGMGIMSFACIDEKGFGHNGAIDEFKCALMYMPKSKTALAVTVSAKDMSLNDLLIYFLKDIKGKEWNTNELIAPPKQKVNVAAEILQKYVGAFSNKDIGMDVAVTLQNGTLTFEPAGQSAMPFTATSTTEFEFKPAKAEVVFAADGKTFTLKQGGANLLFERK
jgi:D-alanyl-D-alanine carboxypeptidase